jgi:hypothetical protein
MDIINCSFLEASSLVVIFLCIQKKKSENWVWNVLLILRHLITFPTLHMEVCIYDPAFGPTDRDDLYAVHVVRITCIVQDILVILSVYHPLFLKLLATILGAVDK